MGDAATDLMSFVASLGGDRQLRVEENLGAGFVRLRVAEAERRQAKHDIRCVEDAVIELLRNARDAGASHLYVASSREGDERTITVIDDGDGIPEGMHERIFDARVTSKLDTMRMDRWGVHGRGMALYSVKENAKVARVVASAPGLGTSIKMVADVTSLRERADQSTWPVMAVDYKSGGNQMRGPHNIIRTCAEFALEEHDACEVYLGSPAELVATARRRVRISRANAVALLQQDLDDLPLLQRLVAAADARELSSVAASLGLDLSERTAQRIIVGEIKPLRSVYSVLTKPHAVATTDVDLTRDQRSIRFTPKDLEAFREVVAQDFEALAERYYLTLAADPVVRVRNGKVTVTFEVVELD